MQQPNLGICMYIEPRLAAHWHNRAGGRAGRQANAAWQCAVAQLLGRPPALLPPPLHGRQGPRPRAHGQCALPLSSVLKEIPHSRLNMHERFVAFILLQMEGQASALLQLN